MNDHRRCPRCGSHLAADAPQGLCPQCLLAEAVKSASRSSDPYAVTQDRSSGASRFVPPTPAELAPKFPQLEILQLLGSGGMGAVYKARQKTLDRIVALKILPPSVAADPAFAERFTRKARALAKLSHPNIVSVFESDCVDGQYYLIMEYVDGANLRKAIQTGQLDAHGTLLVVPQICDALQYAHDMGVVHRDIKPENVLLDRQGRVKIADFGLAKLLGQAPVDVTLTAAYQVIGTYHYMAPEQFERPLEVDHRADIFSLGVVFYELLTGELPLGRYKLPSEKSLDARLDPVVLRTLEREREKRYQRANEVKSAIQSITSFQPIPYIPPNPPKPSADEETPMTDRRRLQFHPGHIIMGTIILLMGVAFAWLGMARNDHTYLWVGLGVCIAAATILGGGGLRLAKGRSVESYQLDVGRLAMGFVFCGIAVASFIYGIHTTLIRQEFVWIGMGLTWAGAGIVRTAWVAEGE